MKRLLLTVGAYAALCGAVRCWGAEADAQTGVLAVIGRFGIAHGCAIGPNVALVAAHTADPFPEAPVPAQILRFSLGDQEGLLAPLPVPLPGADVWLYRLVAGEFGSSLSVADGAPKPGEYVSWWDYDYRGRDEAFAPKRRREKVTRIVAGNIVTRKAPERGASGGCVLNDAGNVVAIVTWGHHITGGDEVGMLAGVWGSWIPAESSPN